MECPAPPHERLLDFEALPATGRGPRLHLVQEDRHHVNIALAAGREHSRATAGFEIDISALCMPRQTGLSETRGASDDRRPRDPAVRLRLGRDRHSQGYVPGL